MTSFTSTGCCCEGDPCIIIPLCGVNWNIISGSWSFSNCTAINNGTPGTILYNTPALSSGQKIGARYNIFEGTVRLIIDAADEDNYLAGEVSSSGATVFFKIIRKSGGVDSVLVSKTVTLSGALLTSPYNRFTFCFNPVTGWAVLDAFSPFSPAALRTQIQTTSNGDDFVGFYADQVGVFPVTLFEYFSLNVYGTTECEPCINSPPIQCTHCPAGVLPQVAFVTFNNVKNLTLNPTRCGGNCPGFNTTFALPVSPGSPCNFLLTLNPFFCLGDVSFGGNGYQLIQLSIHSNSGFTPFPYSVSIYAGVPIGNNQQLAVTFRHSTVQAGQPTCQPPGLPVPFKSQIVNSPCNWAGATCLVNF